MAAIEPACHTILKRWNSRTSLRRFEPLPVECGGGRWRATGWSLQPLTSPSPSAPEVGHRCTTRRNGATPLWWSSSSPRAPPWMLQAAMARGPGNGRWGVGTTGVEWRDDLMQSEWKNNLGDKLFDDCQCAMCTELWQDKTNRWYLL